MKNDESRNDESRNVNNISTEAATSPDGSKKSHDKSAGREAFRYAFPLTVPICAGFLFLGISYGLFAVGQGLPWYLPIIMSTTIFAGSMEFVTVALLTAPFDPLGAFILAFMVNGRHIFYGLTMLTRYTSQGWKKYPLIFGMCDESFALNATVNLPDNVDRGWFYLHVTWLNFVYWVLGVAMGSIGSQFITLNLKGIEFVLAALFAVIFLDILLKGKNLLPGCIGLGVSLLMRIVLGPDVFMLPAMALMVVIFSLLYKFKGKKETDLADEGGTAS